ncbi:MAG: hypothetical protein LBD59_08195 [Prevotellaceae bacterium]|jgi:hypothetical protein|nr:hypothetical protein [Prevotellaceae bacterium]
MQIFFLNPVYQQDKLVINVRPKASTLPRRDGMLVENASQPRNRRPAGTFRLSLSAAGIIQLFSYSVIQLFSYSVIQLFSIAL